MENDQISTSNFIEVDVIDRANLAFFYNTSDGTTSDSISETPFCKIRLTEQAYKRLLSGESTFEDEVASKNFKISGGSEKLKEFGNKLRNS